jgi:tRNA (guanine-N7-)-methyltransferase
VVSFVRRGGRLTPGQRQAWERLSRGILIDVPRQQRSTSVADGFRIDPESVFGRSAELVLEIGGGQGEAIIAGALAHPDRDYLGCEVFRPGLARTMMELHATGSTGPPGNVRLVQADAVDALQALPERRLSEVWTFFPDPWPKLKHHKRRLVTQDFAALLASRMRSGGVWRLATDWADYAAQMRSVLADSVDFENAFPGDAPRFDRPVTKFEQRAALEGRPVVDLAFRRL